MRTASAILLSLLVASAAAAGGTTVTLDATNMTLADAAQQFLPSRILLTAVELGGTCTEAEVTDRFRAASFRPLGRTGLPGAGASLLTAVKE